MARPIEKSIGYFPLNTNILSDMKVRRMVKACGEGTISVIISLLCHIYGDEGYFMKWHKDAAFIIADTIESTEEYVMEVVEKSLEVNFFDREKFQKYQILTSIGIQKRFLKATEKRKNSHLINEYLIENESEKSKLDQEKSEEIEEVQEENIKNEEVSSEETPQSESETPQTESESTQNQVKSTQSKVKESKGKKSKVKESKGEDTQGDPEPPPTPPPKKDIILTSKEIKTIMEKWNSLGLPSNIISIKNNRRTQLKARIKEYSYDDVLKAIESIRESPFLHGNNRRGWIITFDWFIKPNNFPKVLEGNYLNKEKELENGSTRGNGQYQTGQEQERYGSWY